MTLLSKTFSPTEYRATHMVDDEHAGMRLDQYMQIHLESWSREMVKRKIESGDITIEGRPGKIRPSMKLSFRDRVTLVTKKSSHEDEWWNGEKLELKLEPEIIFEDQQIAVITKPPYMATHPTGRHLFNCATVFLEAKTGHTVHSIHRLDRETSGVLLLGKNPKAAQELTLEFEEDRVKKAYFFIAKKKQWSKQEEFWARERLDNAGDGLKRVYIEHFAENDSRGKHAATLFKVLFEDGDYVIGLAFPQTGRQHQIRVHAMAHGLPLVGDKLYLGSFEMFQRFKDLLATSEEHQLMELPRHALHAIGLSIIYQKERRIFSSHLPHDLATWIKTKTSLNLDLIEQKIAQTLEEYFQKI
jgi:23S rRNA pseudouridine1911/1915/1917 synthase